ncbi:unnamed protein product [Acanthoscelides obtectus]|uniref:Aminoacyl-transfer RNA synthetases class-II family profile domain-containing protein n=1 Tax=Acanthoscelides obtectus TaxID=200917 RepID=A0A9P0P6E1_ACAOB|nr:unnamed protein product [Acanthoscelides obtectus]CAK1629321.1 Aspartate--tRNA ligase, mitochondrial [Acanthoscelides obtectus]
MCTKDNQSFWVTKKGPIARHYSTPQKTQQVYLIDEKSGEESQAINRVNKYTNRSYTCGELNTNHIGESVVLCGWLEYQRMNRFVVLRDSYGETQMLVGDKDIETQNVLAKVPYESILEVKGTVLARPKDMVNKKQATGEIEVLVDKLKVVNESKDNLPFNIREFQKAKEPLRMQYRYLDLRFPQMQHNLRTRSKFLMKMREFLVNNHFVDVETPTLFKATPGGAQEFVVPSRHPGLFFSLVQSPQQFKQMLMGGALDRYFQIARCYRDEGSRPDRQPEFTQLDIELSFTDVEGVLKLVEEMLGFAWPDHLATIPMKFDRMTYDYAMENYGNDHPDTRLGFRIKNCTNVISSNKKLVTGDKFAAHYIMFPKEYANLSKQIKETVTSLSKNYPKAKLVQSKVASTKEWTNKISKLLTHQVAAEFVIESKMQDESVLFLAYGDKKEVLALLGKIRLEYANFLENLGISIRQKGMHFTWITDFPLFEISEETGTLQSAHHPFSAPNPEDIQWLKSDPLKVRALAYDLVLNGNEIAGGSIRIHDPSLQRTILDILQIDGSTLEHMLEMLSCGCPPHGGVALGLDRLLSIMLNTVSIRDVIAFPKNFEGRDPLSGAPSPISEKDMKLYHIRSTDKAKK